MEARNRSKLSLRTFKDQLEIASSGKAEGQTLVSCALRHEGQEFKFLGCEWRLAAGWRVCNTKHSSMVDLSVCSGRLRFQILP